MTRDPFTLEDMRLALQYLSPDCDRKAWVMIGMGLKAEFGEAAFDVWDSWSQGGGSYKAADARQAWKSMKGDKVSLGTVVKQALAAGWKPERKELSAEDRKRLTAEAEARRKARQAEVEADEARLRVMQEAVAQACQRIWSEFTKPVGQSAYLGRKRVGAHGVLFLRQKVLLVVDDDKQRADLWTGMDIKRFFDDLPRPRPEHLHFSLWPANALVVPLRDIEGRLWALQSITDSGDKLFPKYGRKSGCFHVLGELLAGPALAVGEGYATMASVHECAELPAVVAFDAGNLARVCEALRARYPERPLLIAGDDDVQTPGNPGRTKAEELSRALSVPAVFPVFAEEQAA